jgi:N-methylhydantoinase A
VPGRETMQAGMKANNSRTDRAANLRLAADIGGTFTDIAVFDDKTGRLTFGKALSTPQRLVDGISSGVEKAGSNYASANLFLHVCAPTAKL